MTVKPFKPDNVFLRRATPDDIFKIAQLYYEVYQGAYPDPLMSQMGILKKFIQNPHNYWFIAEAGVHLIGSMVFEYDPHHKIAKAFGAAISPQYQGHNIAQEMMKYSLQFMNEDTNSGVEVCYAVTRTVHSSAQILTQKLGFKKLGIFPNVHKTTVYETHCLAAYFDKDTLKKRHTHFKLHPGILPLYELARKEVNLDKLPVSKIYSEIQKENVPPFELETINAKKFVLERFKKMRTEGQLDNSFFPFHEPNYLITSPDQKVEVFLYINDSDRHCVIIGVSIDQEKSDHYFHLMNQITNILRSHNVRYIETIVRADNLGHIDNLLKAKFIPCAYFPAFQLVHETRFDFVVFSRSFEIFDFSNIQLEGVYKDYLNFYYQSWKNSSLNPKLIKEEDE